MSIRCEICGRFIAYKDFMEDRTMMIEVWPCLNEPPEEAPAHRVCVNPEATTPQDS